MTIARSHSGLAEPTDVVAPPTDRAFRAFAELILGHAGIHLAPAKKALLCARLIKRIRELGLRSFDAYFKRVTEDASELVELIDRITTNETHFFREPRHFEYLERVLLPEWSHAAENGERPKHLRVWSAGCSTGEEPFSLAMVLAAHFPAARGFSFEILATDISTRVLAAAARATWPIEKAREIPPHYLKQFMLQGIGAQSGWLRAGPELRSRVRFAALNLNGPDVPNAPSFDLVFCRNVLIYFNPATKERAIDRLLAHLAPGGRLFVGHAESVRAPRVNLRVVEPTIYALGDARFGAGVTKEEAT
jgi:chemotaxis protein methyltransferase CheR